ncbi:uncharacterized protein KY384_008387 [Bacidia gigantensis]|uniref:uncharacterized protein n=1 Tax=Bacidia gigantensis TaxID=2732470 RepID=UPI001D03CC54|nr:uncharacterized protein KY384_008387 [Bacidia gigantensis]KAG8526958.1 hypothetical protein KY384_008387 [Bacidia gigantensis]
MGGDAYSTVAHAHLPQRTTGPVGQQLHGIYKNRLDQFIDNGVYASQNLRSKFYEGIACDEDDIKLSVWSAPNLERPPFEEAIPHDFKPTHVGASFGPSWATHWFKVRLRVPESLRTKELLELHWDANNEGLIWNEEGEPLQGLTGLGDRTQWILPDGFRDGKYHTIYIEMACNEMFGNAPNHQPPNPNNYYVLHTARIEAINVEARKLFFDFWILGDAAREFPEDSWQEHKAMQIGQKIMNNFYTSGGSQASILEGRRMASDYFGDVNSENVYQSAADPLIYGIGYCHIDTSWLWPWSETKRKIARSWSNQCDLLDRYPEHRFCCSQPQQFKWLEQLYPKLFDRVKQKVKEGTFQPIGGSWVEHDTNLPGGESLIRQFLVGQRYFQSRFGQRSRTFWLPDTFGYSTQIPQLTRLAGMSRFFTQKLSWNNINNFPHTTFNWVGLDNSQVLCHMAPAETYTAEAHFGDVKRSETQNKSMDQDPRSLLVFGKGDGGGGPTWEHLEKLRRCRGISDQTGLLPRVHLGNSVEDYYDKLEEAVANGTKFVTWYGELYLELHRGCYTTQANNKLNNRKSEIMLHDLEYLSTMATIKDSSYKYPKRQIDDMWEDVLLMQFHDVLPGSAIEMTYRDSDRLYENIFDLGPKLIDNALAILGLSSTGGEKSLCCVNTLPWPRTEVIKMPQNLKDSWCEYAVFGGDTIMESAKREFIQAAASIKEEKDGVFKLQNADFEVEVVNGTITSLWDRDQKREIVSKGSKANQLVIFDDKPLHWEAWDIEVYHLDTRQELPSCSSTIASKSPLRVSLVTETKISDHSWVKTTISLAASLSGQPSYVEMESEVEWRETNKALKVEFPVDIVNTEASYETQFGITRRPTHYNTSWDMAKFEVICHKWADLSENGYGVSILNDSKYGFATAGNVMRLSLLRAPKAPDAHADMGRHHIRYAILPHSGPLDHRTVRTARNFNHTLRPVVRSTEPSASSSKFLSSIVLEGSKALILDTIKRGEDDEDVSLGELPIRKGRSIILRIYESLGGRARGFVKLERVLGVKKVFMTNALEDDEGDLHLYDNGFGVELRAFEVATYRLQL